MPYDCQKIAIRLLVILLSDCNKIYVSATVALRVTVIGSEASYMKEASKMYGGMLKMSGLYP